jgi:hypothetical protein
MEMDMQGFGDMRIGGGGKSAGSSGVGSTRG